MRPRTRMPVPQSESCFSLFPPFAELVRWTLEGMGTARVLRLPRQADSVMLEVQDWRGKLRRCRSETGAGPFAVRMVLLPQVFLKTGAIANYGFAAGFSSALAAGLGACVFQNSG